MNNLVLIDWIKQSSEKAELILSVCTGALLLARAGLLDGLEAATHHGAIDLLRETAPKTAVHADRRFVDNERVICSAGIAAGIDMNLYVVSRLLGHEVSMKSAKLKEYPFVYGTFSLSPRYNVRHSTVPSVGSSRSIVAL